MHNTIPLHHIVIAFSRCATSLFTALLCAFAAFWPGPASAMETITIAADEWPPFTCDPESGDEGYIIDIARAVFEPLGYQVEYALMPWSRALLFVKQGSFTAAAGVEPSEMEGLVLPVETVGITANDFFVRAGDPWRYASIRSLSTVRLGVIADYFYGVNLDAYINKHKGTPQVQLAKGEKPLETNLRKLVHHRLDVVMDAAPVVSYTSRSMGIKNAIEFAGSDSNYTSLYLAFSPALPHSPQLAVEFSKGLRALRKSGNLQEILDYYEVDDWKEQH